MSEIPIELYKSIYNLFIQQGHEKSAAALLKEAKLDKKSITKDIESLLDIYAFYKKNNKQVTKKPDSSDDDSSDSDSDESSHPKPVLAKKQTTDNKTNVTATKAAVGKTPTDDSSSEDSSSSDSSSEDEAPTKPTIALKAKSTISATTKAKQPSSSSESDDSDSDDSDSDSDNKPVPTKKQQPPATTNTKPVAVKQAAKEESSDDDDDDDDDSSEEEEKPMPPAKRAKVEPPKAPAATNKPASNQNLEVCRVLVKGLPWLASQDEVSEFFVSCGKVTGVELPLTDEGRSSGTAIVSFGSRSHFDAAIALDGQLWPGTERWLKILDADKVNERKSFGGGEGPSERPEGCDTLFVGNLPWDIEEQQLWDLFGTVGEVSSVRFATSKEDGSFRGFGHVSFVDGDVTLEAVKLSGTIVNGRAIRLDFAPPKAARESFGGGGRGGGFSPGRGGRGGRDGGRGGGRDGGRGRGRGAPSTGNKSKGSIAISTGSKKTFD